MQTKLFVFSLAFSAILGEAAARGLEGPSGAELFARHFASVGGPAALEAVRSVSISGTVKEADQVREFTFQTRNHMMLLTKRDASGKWSRQARDAEGHCWQQDGKGIREMEPADTGKLLSLSLAFSPATQLFISRRLADAISEADSAWNRPAFATGRRTAARGFPRMWFDSESGLMAGAGHARFRDYRLAGAIQLPHELQYAGRVTYQVARVRFDEHLTEKNFEQPGGGGGFLSGLTPKIVPRFAMTSLLSTEGRLEIVRRPPPSRAGKSRLTNVPKYDPNSGRNSQVDLRGKDLRTADLSDRIDDLLHSDFDSQTLWPTRMPLGFEPERVLELGKNPGLGVRALHRQGITGKGVAVGIIDTVLLTEHKEFADRLQLYEEIHSPARAHAGMHATAVASIAVGRTCGVAPEADLYQVAVQNSNIDPAGKLELDYTPVADAIHRLLDVNKSLPADRKIRVISISMGWGGGPKGHAEADTAVERAKRENVFVISTSLRETHRLAFDGLNRAALAAPDDFRSFGPGSWWATLFWSGELRFKPGKRLCVPMDTRTTAGPAGPEDYAHYDNSGWSWAVPWLAGLYALACQVRPDITPEEFWAEALRTGKTLELRRNGEVMQFGTIADPQALISTLREHRPGNAAG